jgi:hypothetical protein
MSTTERRFTIRWVRPSNGGVGEYKVSIPNYDGGEVVEAEDYDRLETQLTKTVETFAQERQVVLDCVNLYGDETLHKALDSIGWPADYVESGRE